MGSKGESPGWANTASCAGYLLRLGGVGGPVPGTSSVVGVAVSGEMGRLGQALSTRPSLSLKELSAGKQHSEPVLLHLSRTSSGGTPRTGHADHSQMARFSTFGGRAGHAGPARVDQQCYAPSVHHGPHLRTSSGNARELEPRPGATHHSSNGIPFAVGLHVGASQGFLDHACCSLGSIRTVSGSNPGPGRVMGSTVTVIRQSSTARRLRIEPGPHCGGVRGVHDSGQWIAGGRRGDLGKPGAGGVSRGTQR
jgi:hypothetical protein